MTECRKGEPIPGSRSLHGTLAGYLLCHGPACRARNNEYMAAYRKRDKERRKQERAELEALRAKVRELEGAAA